MSFQATPSERAHPLWVYRLGTLPYTTTWEAMRDYTDQRDAESPDQLWLLQHAPVFTQGLAGKPEHVRDVGDIPLVESDRGGQVTYHGPGQLIGYVLLDLKRLQLGIRELVTRLEETLIAQLADYGIAAAARPDAPGVYVSGRKIASLGLRVRRGCSYHGISLNSDMDLLPFQQINPCGYPGLEMTQLSQLGGPTEIQQVSGDFLRHFCQRFPFNPQPQQGTPTTLNAGVKT